MGVKSAFVLAVLALAVPALAQTEGQQVAAALQTASGSLWAMIMQSLPILLPFFALMIGLNVVMMLLRKVTKG